MAQCLKFKALAGIKKSELVRASQEIVTHIHMANPSYRDLREWMRGRGWWDRESTPFVLDFLGVSLAVGEQPVIRENGERLREAVDGDAAARFFFEELKRANLLLLKMVVDALDVEKGGRLHSTHELHRMLTSYVYPGKHVSLVDFQEWLIWAEAAGAIRLVGIRWGLGEVAKESLEWFRVRDVEEILEDEAEDEAADNQAPFLSIAPTAGEDQSEEKIQAPTATSTSETGGEKAFPSEVERAAVSAVTKDEFVPAQAEELDLLSLPEGSKVLRWLQGQPDTGLRGVSWGEQTLGIEAPGETAQDWRRWVAECATAASWIEEGRTVDWATAAFESFRETGVFHILSEGKSVSKCLQKNGYFRSQPGLLRMVGGLLVAEAALCWMRQNSGFREELLKAGDGILRFEILHRGPLGSAYPIGAFWWARHASSLQ